MKNILILTLMLSFNLHAANQSSVSLNSGRTLKIDQIKEIEILNGKINFLETVNYENIDGSEITKIEGIENFIMLAKVGQGSGGG